MKQQIRKRIEKLKHIVTDMRDSEYVQGAVVLFSASAAAYLIMIVTYGVGV